MGGRESESFALLASASPNEYANRNVMLSVVLDRDVAAAEDYGSKRDALSSELQDTLDRVDQADQRLQAARRAVRDDAGLPGRRLAAPQRENNSHVFIPGYVFPVAGPVQFGDSFGYPRLLGTGQQHWHEGCDVMSPMGTPLVAAEDGVVTKVGENSLGGLSLKITGTSGYWHDYAHLRVRPRAHPGSDHQGRHAGRVCRQHRRRGRADPPPLRDPPARRQGARLVRAPPHGVAGPSGTAPARRDQSHHAAGVHLGPGWHRWLPRYADGRPIYTTSEGQATADAKGAEMGLVFEVPPPVPPA